MQKNSKTIILTFVLLVASGFCNAETLCVSGEKTVFSFEVKSKKTLSICKGKNESYLSYKFGVPTKIEMQFPETLDVQSWKKFSYSGISRQGGKINAGFGSYSLTFTNNGTEYSVFQDWRDEDDTYSIGVTIKSGRKTALSVYGLPKTQEGSLQLLDDETGHIQNSFE